MAEIQHELKIAVPRAKVFSALTSRTALEHWHRAKVGEGEREWRIEYPDGTLFRWSVVESSPERVAWRCTEGPGQAVGKEASFALVDAGGGRTLVVFAHAGWLDASGNYRKCNTRWAILLHHLRASLETGKHEPPLEAPRCSRSD
jgi:uncharacterized protein YndB with AHSA1/START domain